MNQFAFLSIAALLLSFTSYAQDSTTAVSQNKYFQVDAGVGYLHTNMSSINALLKGSGYKPMRDNYSTLSIAPTFFLNRFMFRGEATLLLPARLDQPGNMRITFGGYNVSASVGYAVIQNQRLRLYPYIGISGFNTVLKFIDQSHVSNIGEVLNNPHKNATIRFSNASLDLGVQLERFFPLKNNQWDSPQYNKYMTLGMRIGYNWSPGRVKARYNGTALHDAPEFNFQGPYIKVVVGLGKKMRSLKWR